MDLVERHPSSYRDHSGYVFYHEGVLYRQINKSYQPHYQKLMESGLYDLLVQQKKLVPHREIMQNFSGDQDWFRTLQPQPLNFISFPYEWSFDMLKDAALLTLQLTQEAIAYGMILKDATPFNVQLHNGDMIFIDTLSFELYDELKPWIAYRQFCESFLLPLSLMHYRQVPLQSLLLAHPDGIPLPVGTALLPLRSRFSLQTYLHLHLNASMINKPVRATKSSAFTKQKLETILRSLEQLVQSYSYKKPSGVWSNYYDEASLRDQYLEQKKAIISDWIGRPGSIKTATDVGANEGVFSFLLAKAGIQTLAADFDHYSVNELYKKTKRSKASVYPLLIDFSNPSPAVGVNNRERPSFLSRTSTDLVLALAVVHHLAVGKNIPFSSIVQLFLSLGKTLIVEFVPKEDEKVQLMLQHKRDIYDWYTKDAFLQAFSFHYQIVASEPIGQSGRTLYLMQPHENPTTSF